MRQFTVTLDEDMCPAEVEKIVKTAFLLRLRGDRFLSPVRVEIEPLDETGPHVHAFFQPLKEGEQPRTLVKPFGCREYVDAVYRGWPACQSDKGRVVESEKP